MEIGIIIFVIWIIISVISGIVENGAKNKKKKQNTQWPAHPNPSKSQSKDKLVIKWIMLN